MQRAILDGDGILRGFEPIKGEPRKGDVSVPDNCDLDTEGRYIWRHGAFWPLPGRSVAEDNAIRVTAAQVRDAIATGNPKALQWFDAFYALTDNGKN